MSDADGISTIVPVLIVLALLLWAMKQTAEGDSPGGSGRGGGSGGGPAVPDGRLP